MFAHILVTRMKCLIRDRELMFWTLLFPLLLATFFHMAFSNLNKGEIFQPITAAVVDDEAYRQNAFFQELLEAVSTGEERIFILTKTATREEADRLLHEGDIEGYFTMEGQVSLTVKKSGLNQSIMKSFADQYQQTASAVESMIQADPQVLQSGLLEELNRQFEIVKEVPVSSTAPNNVVNYFYTLIAMSCLYGSFLGLKEVVDIQADLSTSAMRVNMSPVHKFKAFLAGISAALIIHFLEMLILLAYLIYVLHIDFGPNAGYVLLTTFIGCMVGLSFGSFVGAAVKKSEGIKSAILLGLTMLGSFLAGMMEIKMKYLVAAKAPVLSYLNPVNLLTDAFYSLYYYDTLSRYLLNLVLLFGFTAVFCLGTYMIIRRRKYASL